MRSRAPSAAPHEPSSAAQPDRKLSSLRRRRRPSIKYPLRKEARHALGRVHRRVHPRGSTAAVHGRRGADRRRPGTDRADRRRHDGRVREAAVVPVLGPRCDAAGAEDPGAARRVPRGEAAGDLHRLRRLAPRPELPDYRVARARRHPRVGARRRRDSRGGPHLQGPRAGRGRLADPQALLQRLLRDGARSRAAVAERVDRRDLRDDDQLLLRCDGPRSVLARLQGHLRLGRQLDGRSGSAGGGAADASPRLCPDHDGGRDRLGGSRVDVCQGTGRRRERVTATATMQAAVIRRHGGPEVTEVEELARPAAGPGEAVVRVAACGLNHLDIFVRRGMPGLPIPLPHVSGGDIAGWVDEIGEGASPELIGTAVLVDPAVGDGALGETLPGGLAEYVVVPVANLIPLEDPDRLVAFAALPIAYGTAYRMIVTRARLAAGETVAILGASGGVGVACVQFAKRIGARVLACTSSSEKARRLRDLGADDAIDVLEEDFSAAVWRLTDKKGADVV